MTRHEPSTEALVTAFVEALRPSIKVVPGTLMSLRAALLRTTEQARQAWPDLALDRETYVRHIAARLADEPTIVEQLGRLAASDLWLACACTQGDSRAIALFEQTYSVEIRRALRRLRDQSLLPDDFRQMLREQLFLGTNGSIPAIARYSGHGKLGAWVRVTAMRAAINATRNRPALDQPGADEDLFEFEPSPDDPEVDHFKHMYRDAFRRAFLSTVAALPASERALLRQSVVHGLSVRQLAQIHGVHHATVARRIAAAREQLVAGTRRILAADLAVSPRELDSIMVLIGSRLDVSLVGALGPE